MAATERKRYRIRVFHRGNTHLIADWTVYDDAEGRARYGETAQEIATSVGAEFCDSGNVQVIDLQTGERGRVLRA